MKRDLHVKISIGEWAAEIVEEIQSFADDWNSRAGDANYPSLLQRGDWDEQFLVFMGDSVRKEKL